MNYTYFPNNLSSLPVEEIAELLRNSLGEIEIPTQITYENLSQTSQILIRDSYQGKD